MLQLKKDYVQDITDINMAKTTEIIDDNDNGHIVGDTDNDLSDNDSDKEFYWGSDYDSDSDQVLAEISDDCELYHIEPNDNIDNLFTKTRSGRIAGTWQISTYLCK